MKNKVKVKIKGKIRGYLYAVLGLGVLLILVDIYTFFESLKAGLLLAAFIAVYFAVVLILLYKNSPSLVYELISFATQYGQIQKQLLKALDLPHAILDENGEIIWTNTAFDKVVGDSKGISKSIHHIFPEITLNMLPDGVDDFNENEFELNYNYGEYLCKLKKVSVKEMAENSNLIETENYEGYLIALYLFDNTALKLALREVDDQSLAIGLVYLDNYDEVMESVEEVRRSLLTALIERKINKYMSSVDGITKRLEKDKYMVILRKSAVAQLKSERFDLLDDVKTVNIGNDMAATLSIGIGLDGLSYAQNYEFARAAIDLALGRGGDQAVVKNPEAVNYFGGKSQQVEKNTRVKARVKAHALSEIINSKDQVFIMGHKRGDVDSFGASIGIYRIAKVLERKAYIVLDTVTTSMQPMVDMFVNNPDYDPDMIINSDRALEEVGNNAVLVIVDVNKPKMTECEDLIKKCKSIVVLDHHRQGSDVVENATLSYVEPYASSTCEMVSEILQYTADNIKIKNEEADCLYSGIMIDTNNFNQKTGVKTFEAAAFLKRNGADVVRVRKMFREDAIEYKTRADCVSEAEIYRNYYAISVCGSEGVASPTIVGAKAANELLNITGVKASFVVTDYQNVVYVSARSIDELNVQVVMEKIGGGGHMSIAGAQFESANVNDVIDQIKDTLDSMIENGEIN
ncbi:MAG: DHH family phosphoesterase [Lachnospiraceae bacterium]|nr:DHH family phosphoesterase [Lachnospiraceae bacterium]